MLDEKFEYMPNKSYMYGAILFSIILLLPLFILSMWFLYLEEWVGFRHMVISFSGIAFMLILCVAEAKLKVIFGKEAIYIQRNQKCKIREYRYDRYVFAYYCKNYKGQKFLILSECELERKRVKKIVFWGGGVGATFYDSCVVLFVDENNKQIDVVREYISKNIKNICEI